MLGGAIRHCSHKPSKYIKINYALRCKFDTASIYVCIYIYINSTNVHAYVCTMDEMFCGSPVDFCVTIDYAPA